MSDDIYQRAQSDAALRERLAAAYSGGEEFDNALWWYAHPDADAPDGTVSPLRRINAFEERMYSRNAHPESALEDAASLAALRARVRADREAVERAIVVASAPIAASAPAGHLAASSSIAPPASFVRRPVAPGQHPGAVAPQPGSPTQPMEGGRAEEFEEQEYDGRAPDAPRRRWWVVPAAAGLVGVLLGAGIALAAVLPGQPASPSGATGDTGDTAPDAVATSAPGPTAVPWALDVLARPQQQSDVPSLLYSTWLDVGTFRALSGPAPLYAARDESGKPCLVLVQDDGGYTADCVDASGFPDEGLTVSGVYRKADPVVSGAGSSADPSTVDATSSTDNDVYAEIDVVWLPSGELSITQKSLVTAS